MLSIRDLAQGGRARRVAGRARQDRRRRSQEPGAHPLRAARTARSTTTARIRAARSARGRSRTGCCAARGTATTTPRSRARRRPASPTRRRASRSRSEPMASTSRSRPSASIPRTVSDVMVETMVRVGRHPRVRHGRSLQPRVRRRAAYGRAARRPHVHRHPPRGRRRVRGVGLRQAHRASSRRASRSPDPASTNLLTGLYDAKVDRAPVLAISGQVPSKVRRARRVPGARPQLPRSPTSPSLLQTVQRDSRSRRADEPRDEARDRAARRRPPRASRRGAGAARPATRRPRLAERPVAPIARSRRPDEPVERAVALLAAPSVR